MTQYKHTHTQTHTFFSALRQKIYQKQSRGLSLKPFVWHLPIFSAGLSLLFLCHSWATFNRWKLQQCHFNKDTLFCLEMRALLTFIVRQASFASSFTRSFSCTARAHISFCFAFDNAWTLFFQWPVMPFSLSLFPVSSSFALHTVWWRLCVTCLQPFHFSTVPKHWIKALFCSVVQSTFFYSARVYNDLFWELVIFKLQHRKSRIILSTRGLTFHRNAPATNLNWDAVWPEFVLQW